MPDVEGLCCDRHSILFVFYYVGISETLHDREGSVRAWKPVRRGVWLSLEAILLLVGLYVCVYLCVLKV
jgi:hypothetical protein